MKSDVISVMLHKDRLEFEGVGEMGVLELIKDQEVVNVSKLEEQIAKFVTEKKLEKKKVKLVLAPEVVYSKTVLVTDNLDTGYEKEKFLNDIPFEKPNLAMAEKKSETELKIWVAHKHLFFPIVHILEKLRLMVLEVTPEGSGVNFLEGGEKPKKSHGWLWLGLLVVLLGVTVSVVWNISKTKPAAVVEVAPVVEQVGKLEEVVATSEAELEASGSATPASRLR